MILKKIFFCGKLWNQVHNMLHNEIYKKIVFSLGSSFVIQAKNKVYIVIEYAGY